MITCTLSLSLFLVPIDISTQDLLLKFTEISAQYDKTLTNLKAINNTISHVLSLVDAMNTGFSQQLGWLMDTLGGTRDGLHNLITLACHCFFLLSACLVLVFLGVSWIPRISLLLLVLINLSLEIKFQCGFSLTQLTGVLLTIVLSKHIYLSISCTSLSLSPYQVIGVGHVTSHFYSKSIHLTSHSLLLLTKPITLMMYLTLNWMTSIMTLKFTMVTFLSFHLHQLLLFPRLPSPHTSYIILQPVSMTTLSVHR